MKLEQATKITADKESNKPRCWAENDESLKIRIKKEDSLEFNWDLIEALEQSDPIVTQSTQGEIDKLEFAEDEAAEFWLDALTEDDVPILTDEMINTPQDEAKSNKKNKYNPDIWRMIDSVLAVPTRTKYSKYHDLYDKFATDGAMNPETEETVISFFKSSLESKKFGVGSLWSVYSCINHLFARRYGKNLNTFLALRMFMKALTKWYVPKKSGVVKTEQVMELFDKCSDRNPWELQTKIWVALCYYGLLRGGEVIQIEVGDVHIDEKENLIWIEYDRPTKTRAEGFSYMIPGKLIDSFKEYIHQLGDNPIKESRFLKNMKNKKSGIRSVNMGESQTKRLRWIENKLGMKEGSITAHTWRRSGATSLADSGISVINLKRAGRWRSQSVAESYVANSRARIFDQMNRLESGIRHGKKKEVSDKIEMRTLNNV